MQEEEIIINKETGEYKDIIKCLECNSDDLFIPVWAKLNTVHNGGAVVFTNILENIAKYERFIEDNVIKAHCDKCGKLTKTTCNLGEINE